LLAAHALTPDSQQRAAEGPLSGLYAVAVEHRARSNQLPSASAIACAQKSSAAHAIARCPVKDRRLKPVGDLDSESAES